MNEFEALAVDMSKMALVAAVLAVVLAVLRSVFRGHAADRQPGPQMARLPAPAPGGGPVEASLPAVREQVPVVVHADAPAREDEAAPEPEDRLLALAEGESLQEFKSRLKKSAAPKKSSISAEMLDTANNYDDKVALVRMLVSEDSGRVAAVLKNMIQRDLGK